MITTNYPRPAAARLAVRSEQCCRVDLKSRGGVSSNVGTLPRGLDPRRRAEQQPANLVISRSSCFV